jgi:predicted Rossmann-fold nucleotide-binding protein
VVRTAQAVIAVDGEYGTLSEIAYALKLGIPVVGLNTWQLAKLGRRVPAIVEATTPAEAVDKALALANE